MELIHAPDVVYWELERGERPVWCGRPEAGPYVSATTRWGRMLMGIPFTVMGSVLVPVTYAIGLLFVLTGCVMLAAPAWNWMKARNTIYVVTNLRLVVIEHVLGQKVTSFPAKSIDRVERREHRNGTGSLVFDRTVTSVRREDGYDHSMVEEKGFFGIRDVGAVWRIVMSLKNRAA